MNDLTMDDAERSALSYLAGHQVMTLATYGPLGLWAAAVFYANSGFDLYFLSAGHTRHAQNLADNERAAGTVQEDYRDWPEIKGIQLEGRVRRLEGAERTAAIDLYVAKYPFVDTADEQIRKALSGVNWYMLRPDRFYFIDNSQGLGHRVEIDVSASREAGS